MTKTQTFLAAGAFVVAASVPAAQEMEHGMMNTGMMQQCMQGMQGMRGMDADEDGAVSKEEFMQVHARMFASMDGDGNGALSEQERKTTMGEMRKGHKHTDH